jgi:YfiH family protein
VARRASLRAGARHVVRLTVTERADGDFGADAAGIVRRRAALVPGPWTWLRQVHGASVVVVRSPGEHAGSSADAAVTACAGAPICVQTADCAPVVLVAPGALAVVHVGWRGLVHGVIDAAAAELRVHSNGGALDAWLGPCIGPECYAFGEADLDTVAATMGDAVRGVTSDGALALDVRAGVAVALERAGAVLVGSDGRCTACSAATCWSHRARGERERHTLVAWLEDAS